MFKDIKTPPNVSCASLKPGIVLLAGRITHDIGRRAVAAMLGGMMDGLLPNNGPDNAQWCNKCEKYFNPKAPHGCVEQDIGNNRERLEKWLGRFKIKEDV